MKDLDVYMTIIDVVSGSFSELQNGQKEATAVVANRLWVVWK